MASAFAFVTLVSSDAYLPGALTQVAALNELHASRSFDTVCLVTPESVDVATIKSLRHAFDLVVGVEILEQDNAHGLALLGRPDLTTVLTKLHVFRLTQFSKIIFLDADVLPIRPIDHLFQLPHEFAAAPDVGWPDIFNSGVLVLTPGLDKFTELNHLVASKPSWDGGDQGLLNEWRGSNWHRLSFTYNTTPTAAYTYAPAYERYGSEINAIHFIGPHKPWSDIPYRSAFSGRHSDTQDSSRRAYHYQALIDRWYDVYDRHYRPSTPPPASKFEVQHYNAVWDTKAMVSPPQVLSLEQLRQLALEGTGKVYSTPMQASKEGTYQSLPLEGRVDLMRPRKQVPVKEASDTEYAPKVVPKFPRQELSLEPFEPFHYDDMLSTPRHFAPIDESRWFTLPTPGPQEVPDSPQFPTVSLPATPTSSLHFPKTTADFYASESESESLLLSQDYERHHHHQRQQAYHHHQHAQHSRQAERHIPLHMSAETHHSVQGQHPYKAYQPGQHHPQLQHRPKSPPLLSWNPAVEPPPTTLPTPSAFPTDTYFANVWDQAPTKPTESGLRKSSPTETASFFSVLPPPTIPEGLIEQGHYRNVTGETYTGKTPSPDRSKVTTVFPWEQKPRVKPGRVFPDTDAPPLSLFISPSSQSVTSTATVPSTPETKTPTAFGLKSAPLSPLYGLPTSLSFTNAWDSVPSIQKYATTLVQPPNPPSLAPAFDESQFKRRRSKGDRSEVSSRDGDDEDNADDEDEGEDGEDGEDGEVTAKVSGGEDDDDSDRETMRRRSRSGSLVSVSSKKKEYRSIGVQTLTVEKKTFGIQAEPPKPEKNHKRHSASSSSSSGFGGKRMWDSPISIHGATKDLYKPKTRSPPKTPSGMRTPREFIVPSSKPSKPPAPLPPTKPSIRITNGHSHTGSFHKISPMKMIRQISNDSSVGSPASSFGPLSPPDTITSPPRRVGRVWDPARGVELFKKGSEEVLARFLRMGSLDDETASH